MALKIWWCVMVAVVFMGAGMAAAKHGEQKGKVNFWYLTMAASLDIPIFYAAFRYIFDV